MKFKKINESCGYKTGDKVELANGQTGTVVSNYKLGDDRVAVSIDGMDEVKHPLVDTLRPIYNSMNETYWIDSKEVMDEVSKLGKELEAEGFNFYGDRYSGSTYYDFYTKRGDNGAICKAVQYSYEGAQIIDITIDQLIGKEPIDGFEKMRRKLGKMLLPQNEAVNPADLTDCPECGGPVFDSKRGVCTKCSYKESLTESATVKHLYYAPDPTGLKQGQWLDVKEENGRTHAKWSFSDEWSDITNRIEERQHHHFVGNTLSKTFTFGGWRFWMDDEVEEFWEREGYRIRGHFEIPGMPNVRRDNESKLIKEDKFVLDFPYMFFYNCNNPTLGYDFQLFASSLGAQKVYGRYKGTGARTYFYLVPSEEVYNKLKAVAKDKYTVEMQRLLPYDAEEYPKVQYIKESLNEDSDEDIVWPVGPNTLTFSGASGRIAALRSDIKLLMDCNTAEDVNAHAEEFQMYNCANIIERKMSRGMSEAEAIDSTETYLMNCLSQWKSDMVKFRDDATVAMQTFNTVKNALSQYELISADEERCVLKYRPVEGATHKDCIEFVDAVVAAVDGKYNFTGRGGSWTRWDIRTADGVMLKAGWDDDGDTWSVTFPRLKFESFDVDKIQKRIACTTEFDNGYVLHNDYFRASSAEAEEKAKQASIENPGKVFYVKYDDIMNPCSDVKWKNGERLINEEQKATVFDPFNPEPEEMNVSEYNDNGIDIRTGKPFGQHYDVDRDEEQSYTPVQFGPDDEFDVDFRYYVYDDHGNVVSDAFEFEEDAIDFATTHNYNVVKEHAYFYDTNNKLRPDGDPRVVWTSDTLSL